MLEELFASIVASPKGDISEAADLTGEKGLFEVGSLGHQLERLFSECLEEVSGFIFSGEVLC